MQAQFLFLGTGSSTGIPVIGCNCLTCLSQDPCNKRLRPSGVVTVGGKKLLIDVGPDFRMQALTYHLNSLDGVLLTHSHFDHVAGLDELRVYYLLHRKALPVLASEATLTSLQMRYEHLFREKTLGVSLAAQLDFHVLEGNRGATTFLDIPLKFITYEQGGMLVTGYRFGTFAYVSDIRTYSETIFDDLNGVKTLVLSALRHKSSAMHLSVQEAVEFAQRVQTEHTFFTHIGHELEHTHTNAQLPPGFMLAHDGLTVEFDNE